MRRQLASCLWAVGFLTVLGAYARAQEARDAKTQAIQPAEVKLGRPVDFERDVYPIGAAGIAKFRSLVAGSGMFLLRTCFPPPNARAAATRGRNGSGSHP